MADKTKIESVWKIMAQRSLSYVLTITKDQRQYTCKLLSEWRENICVHKHFEGELYPDDIVMETIEYVILEGEILQDTLYVCENGVVWQDTYEEEYGRIKDQISYQAKLIT